jgi:hypothetical protein
VATFFAMRKLCDERRHDQRRMIRLVETENFVFVCACTHSMVIYTRKKERNKKKERKKERMEGIVTIKRGVNCRHIDDAQCGMP